jgi:hypothetical protein
VAFSYPQDRFWTSHSVVPMDLPHWLLSSITLVYWLPEQHSSSVWYSLHRIMLFRDLSWLNYFLMLNTFLFPFSAICQEGYKEYSLVTLNFGQSLEYGLLGWRWEVRVLTLFKTELWYNMYTRKSMDHKCTTWWLHKQNTHAASTQIKKQNIISTPERLGM